MDIKEKEGRRKLKPTKDEKRGAKKGESGESQLDCCPNGKALDKTQQWGKKFLCWREDTRVRNARGGKNGGGKREKVRWTFANKDRNSDGENRPVERTQGGQRGVQLNKPKSKKMAGETRSAKRRDMSARQKSERAVK